MAIRGQRPKPVKLHLVDGTFHATKHKQRATPPTDDSKPRPPTKLRAAVARIWNRKLQDWPWLTLADSDKLHMYCELLVQFERKPAAMTAAKLTNLRCLGSELGGDAASRTRIGLGAGKGQKSSRYFKD